MFVLLLLPHEFDILRTLSDNEKFWNNNDDKADFIQKGRKGVHGSHVIH